MDKATRIGERERVRSSWTAFAAYLMVRRTAVSLSARGCKTRYMYPLIVISWMGIESHTLEQASDLEQPCSGVSLTRQATSANGVMPRDKVQI